MASLTHHRIRSAEPQENVDQWMAETGMSFEDMLEQAFEDYFDTWTGLADAVVTCKRAR